MSSLGDKIRAAAAQRTQAQRQKKKRLRKGGEVVGEPSHKKHAPQAGVRISVPIEDISPIGRGLALPPAQAPASAAAAASQMAFPSIVSPHAEAPQVQESPIFRPSWSVTERSTITNYKTAVEVGSHLITPRDQEHFSQVSSSKMADLAYASIGHLGAAVRGLHERGLAEQEKRRAVKAQVQEVVGKLREETRRREQCEIALQNSREGQAVLNAKLGQQEALLQSKDSDLSQLSNENAKLKEELAKVQAKLSEAPTKAIESYKASGDFMKALMEAYTTCWEDAAALCLEKGNSELAAVMKAKAYALRFAPGEVAEEEEEEEEGQIAIKSRRDNCTTCHEPVGLQTQKMVRDGLGSLSGKVIPMIKSDS